MRSIGNIWFYSVAIILSLHSTVLSGQSDTICFNDTILYEVPGPKNSNYEWIVSGGKIIYNSTNKDSIIVVWNQSSGFHTVEVASLSEGNCTSAPEVLEVFVYEPSVSLGEDRSICEDSSELLVLEPDYEKYFWNNLPGSNEFVINSGGMVKIEVKDKYGCWAEDSIVVTQKLNPVPDFIAVTNTLDTWVSLSNLTDSTWQYYWDFGDGTYSDEYNPEIHSFPDFGAYVISLQASLNGCSGTISKELVFAERLKSDFITDFEGCAPVDVAFTNLSVNADTYYWDFGNGKHSSDENTNMIYNAPGIYEIFLYAKKDTLVDISSKTILVHEAPLAGFEVNPTEPNTFEEVNFINKSTGAYENSWDFGDGETSGFFEPIHSYSASGVYDVSLVVWSEYGCYDSLLIDSAITVNQNCRILFPTGFVPNKNGPSGGAYNPAQKVDNNEIFHPIYEKVDVYELKIYSRWGELVFMSNDIDIGWDGYSKGKLAPQDTYIYEAKAKCSTGEQISTIGSVTLIY